MGCTLDAGAKRLRVMNVGRVKVILHRPLEGTRKTATPKTATRKTATLRRNSTGKWSVCSSCECVEPRPLPATGQPVGRDVGLATFAMPTHGEPIATPRFFRREERALAGAQRRLSGAEKGTPARVARRRVVARVHERIAWRRGDFAHPHSRRIVDALAVIAVEDVSVNRMKHRHCLAKSSSDAAWGQFAAYLAHKAAWAGRRFLAVNPAYTSQDCSRCGHRQSLTLADRISSCPWCGLVLDRDLHAARTILRLAHERLGLGQHSLAPA